MADLKITVGLGRLIPWAAPLGPDSFPNLAGAVKQIAEAAHQQWQMYAAGAPLPDGSVIRNSTGAYLRSIQLRQTGPFSAEVFSDLPYAVAIERGMPARDMKKMLNSSLKVRVNKKGERYLIIPFRHNTPNSVMGNALPDVVHNWWKGQTASHITGHGWRQSGTGAVAFRDRTTGSYRQRKGQVLDVRRRIYGSPGKSSWGTRLGKDDLAGMGITGAAAKRLQGMVMFRKPGGKGRYGSHSQYITFRVMTENSKGWQAPAQKGKWPARATAEAIRPIAEEAFREAATRDIQRLFSG